MTRHLPVQLADSVLLLCMIVPFGANLRAQSNEVLGEIELVGATKVEKTSGVWVDGQYLGYLKELKGSKKILLLPRATRDCHSPGRLPRLHEQGHGSAGRKANHFREDGERPALPDAVCLL